MSASACLRFLFSPFGRLARVPFLGVLGWCLVVSLVMATLQQVTSGPEDDPVVPSLRAGLYILAALILILWPLLTGLIRRLHDLNLAGWWILPALVTPIISLVQIVVSLVTGDNTDGSDAFATAYAYANHISPVYFIIMLVLLCLVPSRRPKDSLP